MEINLEPDYWNSEKIFNLANYLVREHGNSENIKLYIDINEYQNLKDDFSALRYYNNITLDETVLIISTQIGIVYIYPTNQKDHVIFTSNGRELTYNITNKIKEYKEEFANLVG